MKRSLFLNSLAAVLLLTPVLVSAQSQDAPPNRPNQRRPGDGPQGNGGQGNGGMMRRGGPEGGPVAPGRMQRRPALKAELGLTDVQQADLRKATESARRDRLRKSTDLKIANMDLRSLLAAERVDEKAVAAKLAEAQAAEGALMKLKVDTVLALKHILTPEQQKKLAEMRAEGGQRRMGRHMRMRGMMKMHGMNSSGPMGQ
ncbi:MAG: periplasmic heavy metal sensor, partial [Vicinamibacteria bacterium]